MQTPIKQDSNTGEEEEEKKKKAQDNRRKLVVANEERSLRIELLAENNIHFEENPILGARPVLFSMLAEVLELPESAASQQVSQQQEQPIDGALLVRYHGFHALLLVAVSAIRQLRIHPLSRRSLVEAFHVFYYERSDLRELALQVVLDIATSAAPLALDLTADRLYGIGEKVAEGVDGGPSISSPFERGRDGLVSASRAVAAMALLARVLILARIHVLWLWLGLEGWEEEEI